MRLLNMRRSKIRKNPRTYRAFRKPAQREDTELETLVPDLMKAYHKARMPKEIPPMEEIFEMKRKEKKRK